MVIECCSVGNRSLSVGALRIGTKALDRASINPRGCRRGVCVRQSSGSFDVAKALSASFLRTVVIKPGSTMAESSYFEKARISRMTRSDSTASKTHSA